MELNKRLERGQALVLMVLAMVVLLGFTALAVDGGMVYSDRRHYQNIADAASLAGGSQAGLTLENNYVTYGNWNCNSSGVIAAMQAAQTAAINRAQENGVLLDSDTSDKHGVDVQCGVDTSQGFADKYLDIRTFVTAQTKTAFAHFVFKGTLQNTVMAVTRIRPRSPLAYGHAIVALNPANCQGQQNGATFHGNALVLVQGGGVFSNGCLRGNGNPDVVVEDGSVSYVNDFFGNQNIFSPLPQKVSTPIPPEAYDVPPPDCSHPAAHNVSGNSIQGTLAPGLYCVTGDIRINGHDTLIGLGVTIYVINGEVRINGNATVQLSAPSQNPDPSPAIPGIVIMAPPSNHNEIQINGTSDSYLIGTVLVPGADINLLGTGWVEAYRSQFIGWNVEAGGTNDMTILWQENQQYSRPAYLDLYK